MQKKTALLAGASGLIGGHLLNKLLNSGEYDSVISLVRRPSDLKHPLLHEVVVDFDDLDPEIIKADHIFCTLGTTIKKAGSQEKFKMVDYQYPLDIAQKAKSNGTELYAIITAMGADSDSSFFYNRVKGDVEKELKKLDYEYLGIFQPSMLLGDRDEKRLGERIGQVAMKIFGFLIPKNYKAIEGEKVASAMLNYAKSPKEGLSVVSSGDMY
ncbi:oxidoreductase [Jiulongibacter sp. NS-SX5]|uniref:oxidoreductase n=1 Tax=Jiulongibacter sp. NS-SX5 TaxID=3463854 RepID=UPI004059E62C